MESRGRQGRNLMEPSFQGAAGGIFALGPESSGRMQKLLPRANPSSWGRFRKVERVGGEALQVGRRHGQRPGGRRFGVRPPQIPAPLG